MNDSRYYCQVLGKRMQMGWEPNSNNSDEYEYGCNVFMEFKEKDKSTLLSLQPYVSWRLWFWIKTGTMLGERTSKQRTELQAALVCTITKRCSLGITLRLISQLWNTMQQWKSTKPTCDHSLKLTGWHNSALICQIFSPPYNEWVRGDGGSQPKRFNKSVTINSS